MPDTYNDLRLNIRQRLLDAGITAATLEAREIVCHAAGKTRDELQASARRYIPEDLAARVQEVLARRLTGEPLAYLIGEWDFYGMTFQVTRDVLIPRTDTEVLCQAALKHIAARELPGLRVLDLCCGSGCLGLAVAKHAPSVKDPDAKPWDEPSSRAAVSTCRITLADIDEAALAVTRQNAREHGITAAILNADALAPPPEELGSFDLILCNPPYIAAREWEGLDPGVKDHEPRRALCDEADGLSFYHALAGHWGPALRPGGTLFVECGHTQAGVASDIFVQAGWSQRNVLADDQGIQRVLVFSR
jgi:release factor glutamine methyltransferase